MHMLEPEQALYSDILLFLPIDNVTICPFYDISQILSCTFTIFFRRVSFKMIGYYVQMTNSQPLSRLV